MKQKPQVDRSHYFKRTYITPERFASYGYQVNEILNCQPKRVLEVGIGNGFVSHVLRSMGLNVTTLDLDPALKPDIVASVTDLPFPDNTFDIIGCFEVLEHIPYEFVPKALSEMARTTCRHVLISLPDFRHMVGFELLLPRFGKRKCSFSFPRLTKKKAMTNDEHFWEIGKSCYPLKRITKDIKMNGFELISEYRANIMFCHHFFKLRKLRNKN